MARICVGDRVQLTPGVAIGTVEKIRDDVAEVRWDTGARCPIPLTELAEPEDRSGPKRAEAAAAARDRTT